ncbi:radical SAM protein [Candidatus Uhrbacteria bacterium]|nr:radical SAM protein [Candidatus Uhrbacteria bacterium]
MKTSRYLCLRERGPTVVLFHELHPVPIYIKKSDWDEFQGDMTRYFDWIDDLMKEGLLIETDLVDDQAYVDAKKMAQESLSVPRILYLILAQGCNFSCGYCPIPRLSEAERSKCLSKEDACAGLDLWEKHVKESNADENYIIFYGGEPLLNKETFCFCLEEIARRKSNGSLPVGTAMMLATNGTLLDENLMSLCRTHDVLVALGVDGPKSRNDKLRVYATNGNGTYDDILAKLKMLQVHGVRTAVSTSLTPHVLGSLQELDKLLQEVGVTKYGINFLKGKGLIDMVSEENRMSFVNASVEEIINRYRSTGDASYEYQVEKKIRAFKERAFFPIDCTCYGNQLVIRADGGVSNCPFYDAKLGHVALLPESFRISQTKVVEEWRKRSPLEDPSFKDEDGKALAGNGCAWSSIDAYGNPWHTDEAAKQFSLTMFEIALWLEAPNEEKNT